MGGREAARQSGKGERTRRREALVAMGRTAPGERVTLLYFGSHNLGIIQRRP
jgi:hypothetical protein